MSALIVVVDGCREDYIDPVSTPFVFSLRQEGSYTSMAVAPSFTHRIELFTGLAPSTIDAFVAFCFSPDESPFRWLRRIRLPLSLHTGFPKVGWLLSVIHWMRSGVWSSFHDLSLITALHYALTKTWVDFGRIPLSLLPYLSVNEAIYLYDRKERSGGRDHLFGILKAHGFDVQFIYGDSDTITRQAIRQSGNHAFVRILHYGDLDEVGHRCGPSSPQVKATLGAIDRSIRQIYSALKDGIDFCLILSDHDMVEVQHNLDLWRALQGLKARFIDDYLVFLNAPLARFWFRRHEAETEIRELLDGLSTYGRIVSKQELEALGIPTDDRYGHLIYWVKPGVIIWPNFYHSAPFKGMHTYFDQDSRAPLLLCHREKNIALTRASRLSDVSPTILELLGLPITSMDGKSLLVK